MVGETSLFFFFILNSQIYILWFCKIGVLLIWRIFESGCILLRVMFPIKDLYRCFQAHIVHQLGVNIYGVHFILSISLFRGMFENALHLCLRCLYPKVIWSSLKLIFHQFLDFPSWLEHFFILVMTKYMSPWFFHYGDWFLPILLLFGVWGIKSFFMVSSFLLCVHLCLLIVSFVSHLLQSGSMHNSLDEHFILHGLGTKGVPYKVPNIILVSWILSNFGWIKLNRDCAALDNPGPIGCGGVFRHYKVFFKKMLCHYSW